MAVRSEEEIKACIAALRGFRTSASIYADMVTALRWVLGEENTIAFGWGTRDVNKPTLKLVKKGTDGRDQTPDA